MTVAHNAWICISQFPAAFKLMENFEEPPFDLIYLLRKSLNCF